MIRTLQKKFTVTAMIAVTVLLVLLLGGINLFNILSVVRDGEALLGALAAQEDFGPAPRDEFLRPDGENGLFRRSPDAGDRMSALTFSVRFDGEGTLVGSDLSRIADLSEEDAAAYARQALDSGKTGGRIGAFRFRVVQPAPEARTVVFLDMSRQAHELLRVAALSGLGGIAAWLAMLLLVRTLSRLAIRPVAENMERQRRFVTDAGHELKTPLAIIRANAEAMELMGGESKYSRNILSQAARLSDLMQNLLTLARYDEGAALQDRQALSLTDLTKEVWDSFLAPAELKKLSCSADLAEDVTVSGSPVQLRQLLSILLDNSVKYCPEEGSLELSLRREDKAVLRVKNSVSEKAPDPERFFDRFYRADASRSRETGGNGIGLSAAQAIAQGHKGSIHAAYEGDAIVFTLALPLD